MFSTFIVLVCLAVPVEPNPLWPQFSLECSQEELCIGDTLYLTLQAKNTHEKPIYLGRFSSQSKFCIQTKLTEPDVYLLSEVFLDMRGEEILTFNEIKPNEFISWRFAFSIPPLEDLHTPGWEEFVKDLPPKGKKLTFETTINAIVSTAQNRGISEEGNRVLTHKFLIKPRSSGETALIEKWYQETPRSFFPYVVKDRDGIPKYKVWTWGMPKYLIFDEQTPEDEQKTEVWGGAGKKVFFNEQTPEEERRKLIVAFHHNRYPTYPNAPITWQGWLELEESIAPSTMRDEIRMTRICIQYLQTRDDSVFEELKEWLGNMEEPQRTVMAYGVLMQAINCYGTNLLTPLGHVYRAIDEYYVPIGQTFLRDDGILD